MELKERLENSFHFVTATIDKMLLELSWCSSPPSLISTLDNMDIQLNEDSVRYNSLRDNRDLEVIIAF